MNWTSIGYLQQSLLLILGAEVQTAALHTANPLPTTAVLPLSKYLVPSKEVHARLDQVIVPGLDERKEMTAFCYPEL